MNRSGKNYEDMTPEELQREFRETFFKTDLIDDYLNDELEKMQEALDRKKPVEYLFTPEESWARFLTDNAEELEPFLHPESAAEINPQLQENDRFDPEKSWQRFMESRGEELAEFFGLDGAGPEKTPPGTARSRLVSALLRKVLIAAVIVVLLAGAALAANSLGLVAWIRGWSDNPERYAQTGSGSPGPIKEALQDLGIDDPVYPAWLPSNYILTETLISKDPLLLYELYTKADRYVSITITPISAANTAIYPQGKWLQEKNQPGKPAHYIFSNDESITVVWYTEDYFTSISSNITAGAMERIIESVYTGQTKGGN